jgi:apolipoprotein N-acyltransferase
MTITTTAAGRAPGLLVPAPRDRLGWGWGLVVGALAGLLVALSIPPFGFWPLAWIGLAVVAYALPGTSRRTRLAIGLSFGVVDYAIGLLWVQEFSVYGYGGVVLVSALYVTVAVLLVPAGRRVGVAVALPCLFVLSDWARNRFPLGGLPLGGLALGQAAGPLAPVLRLGGSLALTGLTVLVGVLIAEAVRTIGAARSARTPHAPTPDRPAPGGADASTADTTARAGTLLIAVAVVAVALPIAGYLSPSGAGGHLAPLRVALVQGGGPRGTRAISTDPQVVFDRHLQESAHVGDPVDLIVWPEGVLQAQDPDTYNADAAQLAQLAMAHHATVVSGAEQQVGASHYLNDVLAWNSSGQVVGRYVKNHLVPFGEYVPYRSLIERLFNVADVPYDAIPGHSAGFLRTPAGPLAVMISYEVFFDERARGGVRAGGQLLVVPTNTASYRSTQVPAQEVAADKLRAWETGRWLVQVTPTGYSTVVTPTGAVVRKSHLDSAQVESAVVPLRTGMTVYDRIGDTTVALLALAGWLAASGGFLRRAGRRLRGLTGPIGRPRPDPQAAGPAPSSGVRI